MLYEQFIKIWKDGINKEQLDKFFLKFTYCSNKIENDETRLRDVETIFKGEPVTDFKGSNMTLKEI